jgi:DNA-binding XRE family transcriptional regulator
MTDLMIKVLQQIRDEIKATRSDLSERIDETNTRLEKVERRQVDMELRLATELVAVSTAIGDLKKVILEDRKLRAQVSDHEQRLRSLEKKRSA